MLVGCLTSQQHASVSQGLICSDNFTCCHTETEVAYPTFHLTQSQYTDTGPTSPSTNRIPPGAWQASHWSANFEVTGMTRPPKKSRHKRDSNPGSSALEADALTTRPTRWFSRLRTVVSLKRICHYHFNKGTREGPRVSHISFSSACSGGASSLVLSVGTGHHLGYQKWQHRKPRAKSRDPPVIYFVFVLVVVQKQEPLSLKTLWETRDARHGKSAVLA